MGEWKTDSLSSVCDGIISGSTPPTGDSACWDGTYVWITPNDLSSVSSPHIDNSARKLTAQGVRRATRKLLPANSVIISNRAPVGYCAVVTVPFTFNQGCKGLICNRDTDPLYVYYCLSTSKAQLERVSSGTTFLELPKKELSRFKIRLPVEKTEQSKIAEVLSATDEAIEKTRTLIEKYQNIKAGLMQDFLPNGIDEHGNIRSPETHEYKESPLGRIPVEWDCVQLGTICNCITKLAGFEYTKYFNSYNDGGEIIVVRGTNITNNKMDLSNVKNIPRKTSDMLPRSQLHKGELVFAYVGTIGPTWLIDENYKYHLGPNTAKISVNGEIDVNYIYQYFTSQLIKDEINLLMGVGAQPSLSMTKIRNFRVLKPKLKAEQTRIADFLSAADERIQIERDYLSKLEDVKRGLMQDLLTNKVCVEPIL